MWVRVSGSDRRRTRRSQAGNGMSTSPLGLRLLLLTCVAFTAPGVQTLTVTPDRGSTFDISSTQAKGCRVCTGSGNTRQCDSKLVLKDSKPVSVEFDCSKPQDVFKVEITRNIECSTRSCSGHIVQSDAGSLPFLDFNRIFTWTLRAPKAFKIDFTQSGVRQINPWERCPDRLSYSLDAVQASGIVFIGKYCRTGSIRNVQILNQGSLSLDVPAGQKLPNEQLDVSIGEEITSLGRVTVTLPAGKSPAQLLSPNYPDSFPNDDLMAWYFQVPDKHKATIRFLNVTSPSCLKKAVAVEYHSRARGTQVQKLTEPQAEQLWGDFSMTLRNCDMDRRRAGSPGLRLGIQVSTARTGVPELCQVDMSKVGGLFLYIEKVRPSSPCQMKMNSVAMDKITVTSNSQLSFQNCLPEDVKVTATNVIECRQLKDCPKTPVRLSLPVLPSCLPAPLSSVTWMLRPPPHGTVQLTAPTGPLKQALPQQPCNDSIVIHVAEADGAAIGDFCPQGAIQKIQIHTNMSVTVSSMGKNTLKTSYRNVLDAFFKEEIAERYIFTVSPKKDKTVLLATPGWPDGMKSYSTVSWIVSIPSKAEAHLMFADLKQPKCSNRHTNIKVQRVGRLEEDYSRREDEEAEHEISVSDSFYLNMSNCMPERGVFRVITKITLQPGKNAAMAIGLSVVAALLVISFIVLFVVCFVIKKKKKQLEHEVSVYNSNGAEFLPGQNFPKSRADNESHVYEDIEDTLVYTHLLRKGMEIGTYGESDSYRSYAGHGDSQRPPDSKGSDDMEVGEYLKSSEKGPPLPNRPASHPLVDNEIYQSEEEERSPDPGRRMDPEGGNSGGECSPTR